MVGGSGSMAIRTSRSPAFAVVDLAPCVHEETRSAPVAAVSQTMEAWRMVRS